MHPAIQAIEATHFKPAVPQVQSGDTVKVHQLIREGNKQRIQVFEGVVIRTHRLGSLSGCITVRRIASGVGVEKTFLLHSPNVSKIEILRRAKVRRNFLSFLRERRGKSARLKEVAFDKVAANEGISFAEIVKNATVSDEDVTELDVAESQDALDQVTESTEELAKTENKEAQATDDSSNGGDNEQELAAEEANDGVEKAGDEAKQ